MPSHITNLDGHSVFFLRAFCWFCYILCCRLYYIESSLTSHFQYFSFNIISLRQHWPPCYFKSFSILGLFSSRPTLSQRNPKLKHVQLREVRTERGCWSIHFSCILYAAFNQLGSCYIQNGWHALVVTLHQLKYNAFSALTFSVNFLFVFSSVTGLTVWIIKMCTNS